MLQPTFGQALRVYRLVRFVDMNAFLILLVFLLSVGLTWYLCLPTARVRILDTPNARSLHKVPVPRTGGLAVLAAIVVGLVPLSVNKLQDPQLVSVVAAAAVIAMISFVDDLYGVSATLRLLIHATAALLVLAGSGVPALFELPGWQWHWPSGIAFSLSALFVIWLTNLYNFMDGMDGLAGGMTVIGFGAYAMLGWQADAPLFVAVSLIIAAAAAGFLVFNFTPARIFMGDVGAATLGFLCACLTLWATFEDIFPIWLGILVFSPFIADATLTLLSRLAAGRKVWQAHRSHYYQRLVRLGWGHRKTVLSEYALMMAAGLSANAAIGWSWQGQWVVIVVWCLLYAAFAFVIYRLESIAMLEG